MIQDRQERWDHKVLREILDQLDPLDPRVPREFKDRQVRQVQLVLKASLDPLVIQDPRALQETRVQLAPRQR